MPRPDHQRAVLDVDARGMFTVCAGQRRDAGVAFLQAFEPAHLRRIERHRAAVVEDDAVRVQRGSAFDDVVQDGAIADQQRVVAHAQVDAALARKHAGNGDGVVAGRTEEATVHLQGGAVRNRGHCHAVDRRRCAHAQGAAQDADFHERRGRRAQHIEDPAATLLQGFEAEQRTKRRVAFDRVGARILAGAAFDGTGHVRTVVHDEDIVAVAEVETAVADIEASGDIERVGARAERRVRDQPASRADAHGAGPRIAGDVRRSARSAAGLAIDRKRRAVGDPEGRRLERSAGIDPQGPRLDRNAMLVCAGAARGRNPVARLAQAFESRHRRRLEDEGALAVEPHGVAEPRIAAVDGAG